MPLNRKMKLKGDQEEDQDKERHQRASHRPGRALHRPHTRQMCCHHRPWPQQRHRAPTAAAASSKGTTGLVRAPATGSRREKTGLSSRRAQGGICHVTPRLSKSAQVIRTKTTTTITIGKATMLVTMTLPKISMTALTLARLPISLPTKAAAATAASVEGDLQACWLLQALCGSQICGFGLGKQTRIIMSLVPRRRLRTRRLPLPRPPLVWPRRDFWQSETVLSCLTAFRLRRLSPCLRSIQPFLQMLRRSFTTPLWPIRLHMAPADQDLLLGLGERPRPRFQAPVYWSSPPQMCVALCSNQSPLTELTYACQMMFRTGYLFIRSLPLCSPAPTSDS